jgi:hypothetical protein
LELEILDFDLQSSLKDITDFLAVGAHEKGLKLVSLVDPEVPSTLRGDSEDYARFWSTWEAMP